MPMLFLMLSCECWHCVCRFGVNGVRVRRVTKVHNRYRFALRLLCSCAFKDRLTLPLAGSLLRNRFEDKLEGSPAFDPGSVR